MIWFKNPDKGQTAPLERDVVVEEESPPNYSTATGEEVNIIYMDGGDDNGDDDNGGDNNGYDGESDDFDWRVTQTRRVRQTAAE